jgi:hypothetical protein
LIEEVCDIIAHHHHPRPEESVNFRVLYDADMITNLEEEHKDNPLSEERLLRIIEKSFLTEDGASLAKKVLLAQGA